MEKHGLLIGINDYLYPEVPQLLGCVNDVELIAKIITEQYGFAPERVECLFNQQATREAIRNAMDRLVASVAQNDIVLIYYCGHGSQRTDLEGDEGEDGMDETIVPYDSGRLHGHPNRDITDDEIYLYLRALSDKTSHITLIFDSCHSGTITRFVADAPVRLLTPDTRDMAEMQVTPTAIPPTILSEMRADRAAMRAGHPHAGGSGWLPRHQSYTLIAGCLSHQSTYEHRTVSQGQPMYHGALTFFLARALLAPTSGLTYRDLFERASVALMALYPQQTPTLEGAGDREVFGARDLKPMPYLLVQTRDASGNVTLSAGAAHGLTAGSQWTVFAPGIKQTHEEMPLGTIAVSSMAAVTATARIESETVPGSIVPGSRAFESWHRFGEMRLKIALQAPADFATGAAAMREAIARWPRLLRLADEEETPDVRLVLLPPRDGVGPDDPAPILPQTAVPTWAVISEDDRRLVMPPRAVHDEMATVVLPENLEKIARWRCTRQIRNPALNNPLADQVMFRLLQVKAGKRTPPTPDPETNQIVLTEGDEIDFWVSNQSGRRLYVYILGLGLAYGIYAIYPADGSNQAVEPGQAFAVNNHGDDPIILGFPPQFPIAPNLSDAADTVVRDVYKCFVTTQPTDFLPLLQPGVRAAAEPTDPLQRLLNDAAYGSRSRDGFVAKSGGNWWTTEISFLLKHARAGAG